MEILDDLLQGFLDAEDFLTEEVVVWLSAAGVFDTRVHNHMINAFVRESPDFCFLSSDLKVLGKRPFPL